MPEPTNLYVVHDSREDGDDMLPSSFHVLRWQALSRIEHEKELGNHTLAITKIQIPPGAEALAYFLDDVSFWGNVFDGSHYAIPEYGS